MTERGSGIGRRALSVLGGSSEWPTADRHEVSLDPHSSPIDLDVADLRQAEHFALTQRRRRSEIHT